MLRSYRIIGERIDEEPVIMKPHRPPETAQ
jgi:hypothetical protein